MNIPSKPASIDVETHGNFIDGREVEAGNGVMLDVRNPATGDVIARIPNSTAEDIDRAMKSARAAFEGKAWGGMDTRARARLVNKLADAFEANLDSLYRLETLNNGRPVNETRAQLSRLPDFFRYFAGVALARRDSVIPVEGAYLNYTLRTPIGIVANCTPFNHPLMILCKSLAVVLATGCVTVVKPSEYTPLTTLKLAQIFTEAGLPPGVFNIVLGLGQSAGKMLSEHGDINKLVLTGGTEAGRIAGSAAAKVFAHQTMELGGKTPVMVFDDFDVDRAVNYAAFGAFIGAGQTCVCASRHIVQATIYDEFVEKLQAKTRTIRVGDPFDANTQMGPVISARQRDPTSDPRSHLRRLRPRGWRASRHRRCCREGAGSRQRLFRRADRVRRRHIRHAHLPGGSVRSLHLGDAVQGRGRCAAACQQFAVRPRRGHPHPRRRARASCRRLRQGRHRLDQ
ncbi:acyl-CoA reductase-like NAD-dependent aldehyde dehydrogenase [Bradyrhizobium sp. i1.3.6]